MSRTSVSILLLIVSLSAPLSAHEKGAIHLKAKEVPAGGELVIRGEKLPKSAPIRLTLRGALASHALGEVRTTATGTFDARITLPAEARPGSYSVVALADDGDAVARAELVVTAPLEVHDMATHAAADTSTVSAPHPTADMMKLDSSTSGVEWGVIAIIIALSLAGGFVLLAGARHSA